MARFNIAFDQVDAQLGHYFLASKNDLNAYLNGAAEHTINEIPSHRCNVAYIDLYLPTINHQNFVFVAYSHGGVDCLSCSGAWYINSPANTHNFVNSFFYAMACNTAKTLGPELITKGCLAYIGYDDLAWALSEPNQQISIDCDNRGLKAFINGGTLAEAFEEMKNFFKISIANLIANGQLLAAGALRKNLAALRMHGNGDIRFEDF